MTVKSFIISLSLLLSATSFARMELKHDHDCDHVSHFGTAGFSVTDPNEWYIIATNSYPEVEPLSLQRNTGNSAGRVYLSPTGFTIGEAGDYLVSITAVLQNGSEDEALLVPVFLAVDDEFLVDDKPLIGGVVTLTGDEIETVQGTGTVKNLPEGSRLSLVITNGGYPMTKDVIVASWAITVLKI
jgi:hypothetical protein